MGQTLGRLGWGPTPAAPRARECVVPYCPCGDLTSLGCERRLVRCCDARDHYMHAACLRAWCRCKEGPECPACRDPFLTDLCAALFDPPSALARQDSDDDDDDDGEVGDSVVGLHNNDDDDEDEAESDADDWVSPEPNVRLLQLLVCSFSRYCISKFDPETNKQQAI